MEDLPQDRLRNPARAPGSRFSAVVIGGSAGGISAVSTIVAELPATLRLPVVVALHQSAGAPLGWVEYLGRQARLPVVEAEDKMPLVPGRVHCAPAGYHLLLETDAHLALSVDEKINFSRPSIDLLFSSAAEVFGARLIGIVLTGANDDGARGLAEIVARGGLPLVQSPRTAEWPMMPAAALAAVPTALELDLQDLAKKLLELSLL